MRDNWGSDGGAIDIGHLIRIPGTEHRKQPKEPFMITTVHEDAAYQSLEELSLLFPPVAKPLVVADYDKGDDGFNIRTVVVDVWAEKGMVASFDEQGHLVLDGVMTATFQGRHGTGNFMATTSTEHPAQGNATTYVAGTLGISTGEAYKWLGGRYGFPSDTQEGMPPTRGDIKMEDLMYVESKQRGREYLANDENVIRIFNHYKLARYDNFKARPYLCVDGEWIARDSGSDGKLYSWLVAKFPFLAKMGVNRVADLLTFVQYRNTYDSAQEYVNGLQWDGVDRLDTWLSMVFFVEKDNYYRDIGSKWYMGMVARILMPGCKFDSALVVHGGQNISKSSVFLIIAGEESHVEFTDLKVREMQQDMQGKMIVEFAEAAIFSKADSESLKSIVSRQTDTFRVPYERHAKDFPRRCVFAVTANNDDILKDSTGARRWWAVDVPDDMKMYPPKRQADIHWLKDNRDQLFAEAAVRVRAGEDYRKINEYELIRHQQSITATEQDEDLFFEWYHRLGSSQQNAGVSVREAYVGAYKRDSRGDKLDITSVSIRKSDEMRVGRILKKIGLEKRKSMGLISWVPGQMFERNYAFKLPKELYESEDF